MITVGMKVEIKSTKTREIVESSIRDAKCK
jgi:hypothetical protein